MRVFGPTTPEVFEVIFDVGFRPRINRRGRPPDITIRTWEDNAPCCPHEYSEIIEAILRKFPEARITTPIANYKGWSDFRRKKRYTLEVALKAFPCDVDH